MIGSVIADEYRVEALIGEGGFGSVYRCRDLNLDRDVALKFLKCTDDSSTEFRRFQAEARHLGGLQHPNVVHVHRLGHHNGQPFIAMEFIAGVPLRITMQSGPVALSRVTHIFAQVTRGLSALHSAGLIHRDLSPNNIMVSQGDQAKILDLGLAKDLGSATNTSAEGKIVGTFKYMSPEQLEGRPLDSRSDNFSLATIIYELIAGTHPFEAEHHMSVLYSICHRRHRPLHHVAPSCPARLSEVIDLYLAKDPDERLKDLSRLEAQLTAASSEAQRIELDETVPERIGVTSGSAPKNPYLNRVMIKRRADFFGRDLELRRIFSRLNASTPGSISVIGDRKVGKSSLLNYVYMRGTREEYLEHPDQTIMVFLDFQEQKDITVEGFATNLLGMAELELKGKSDIRSQDRSLEGIKAFIQDLDVQGFRLVLLMDEFEAITDNPNFELEFFSFLRYLANHYNVAFLTSSARDLQALCHAKEIRDSPFFNIFTALRLGAFTPEAALRFIEEPSAAAGYPLSDYAAELSEMAGLLPFYLQVACCHAVEFLQERDLGTPLDLTLIRASFYEEALLHFRQVWVGLEDDEQSVIRIVQSGKHVPESLLHVGEELQRRELLQRTAHEFSLFSRAFVDFVQSECRDRKPRGILGRALRLLGGNRS